MQVDTVVTTLATLLSNTVAASGSNIILCGDPAVLSVTPIVVIAPSPPPPTPTPEAPPLPAAPSPAVPPADGGGTEDDLGIRIALLGGVGTVGALLAGLVVQYWRGAFPFASPEEVPVQETELKV